MALPFDQAVVRVPRPVHDRLTEVKQAIQAERQREVPYSEVVEYLLTFWEQTGELLKDVREVT